MSAVAIPATNQLRTELGDFSSIVCFKALVTGTEEALGEKAAAIALIAAGRNRGKQIVEQYQLAQKTTSLQDLVPTLQAILGQEGTRLCIVDSIVETDSNITVACRETICSAGEPQGSSRRLSFTLGAIQGVLEKVTGKRLRGKQTDSVLRGGTHDVVEFEFIG